MDTSFSISCVLFLCGFRYQVGIAHNDRFVVAASGGSSSRCVQTTLLLHYSAFSTSIHPIHPSIYPPIRLSIHLRPCLYPFIHSSTFVCCARIVTYLYVYISYLSNLSLYQSINPSVCLSIHPSIYVCVSDQLARCLCNPYQ